MKTQRDAFFDELYEIAKKDCNVILVSADMAAPSLDKFRSEFSEQFVNVGIAEQNMIAVATGLALSGKKPFCYAITPFATLRCYEAIKVNVCMMNLPVTIVGVGSGFSYDDSGPTHHSIEDISIMRVLPNITIYNASDSVMAGAFAKLAYESAGPTYVRLDREQLPQLCEPSWDFQNGLFLYLRQPSSQACVVATGNMVHQAWERGFSVIDLFRLKPVNVMGLLAEVRHYGEVFTLEEHLLAGGLGSLLAEIFVDNAVEIPLRRMGAKDQFYYVYGGRKNIQKVAGLWT